jgi:hypothetical protein
VLSGHVVPRIAALGDVRKADEAKHRILGRIGDLPLQSGEAAPEDVRLGRIEAARQAL